MHELIYAQEAENDLIEIFDYIAMDNVNRAKAFLKEIEQSIIKLASFPNMGIIGKYKELQDLEIRILIHKNYLIFYRINVEAIQIVRVKNASTNYQGIFKHLQP